MVDPILVQNVFYTVVWLTFLGRAPRNPAIMRQRGLIKGLHGVAIAGWIYIATTRAVDDERALALTGAAVASIAVYVAFAWERKHPEH